MPLHPDFVYMLASADHHKEAGYHQLSKYMDSEMAIKFSPEIQVLLQTATGMTKDDDNVTATVGQLALVALVDYMERFETERLEKEG